MTTISITEARANLPEAVASKVIEMAKMHRIRKIGFTLTNSVYLDEDGRYTALVGNDWKSVRVGGEWAGYTNAGLIAKDMAIPVGAFVIESQIFLGKWLVRVYHNNGVAQVR